MPTDELLPFKEIPQGLLEEVGAGLQHYFVPILGLFLDGRDYPLGLVGSGTLVKIETMHCVLTAAHVWRAAEKFPAVGLSLTAYESWFQIAREHIVARTLGSDFMAFGPDLALLELPAISVGRINAHKVFLDLVQQRQAFLTEPWELDRGIWAVTGMSGEESEIDTQPEEKSVMANVQGPGLLLRRSGISSSAASGTISIRAPIWRWSESRRRSEGSVVVARGRCRSRCRRRPTSSLGPAANAFRASRIGRLFRKTTTV